MTGKEFVAVSKSFKRCCQAMESIVADEIQRLDEWEAELDEWEAVYVASGCEVRADTLAEIADQRAWIVQSRMRAAARLLDSPGSRN
jgi:hypothetical protein